jgi:type I restriction enzyme M protein
MLDTDTKRRIDNCRDILVGKVPDPKSQVEQITIALIYKFMDDMDAEAEELGGKRKFFFGTHEKYGWSKLMGSNMGGIDILMLYSEAIQKMNENPGIPPLFRDIFKNAYLPYRDPETLRSFLKEINTFSYDHSEKLGDAFEYLLSVLGSQGDAGQFRTPRHIIEFIVDIIDPKKNETILDPACGTAGFLISAYKHILDANTKERPGDKLTPDERKRLAVNIHGYDISPDMVRLSLVNLYLHGFANPRIEEYDTLTSEDKWNEYADIILANPPFMSPKGGIKPHKRFSVQASRSEVLFVDYIAEHLTPTGRAGIIVPEGIIFQSGTAYKQLREMLVKNSLIAVISLPAGVFNPYSGVKTSVLILDKRLAKNRDSILFAKIENDGFGLGAQRRAIEKSELPETITIIKEWINHETPDCAKASSGRLETHENKNILVVPNEKLAANGDYNLSGERYRDSEKQSSRYELVHLGDVCEVIAGQSPEGQYYNEREEGIPFFQGKTEFSERYVGSPKMWTTKVTKLALPNDILISVRAPVGPVNLCNRECCIGRGLASIRPKEGLNISYLYVFHVLRAIEEQICGNAGATFASINKKEIEEIKIPLPPLEIQKEIVAEIEGYQKVIDGARTVLDNYRPHIPIHPDWPMRRLADICETITDGDHQPPPKAYEGVPFVTITNINDDHKLDFTKTFFVPESYYANLNLSKKPKAGDILYTVTGSYGISVLVDTNTKFCFQRHIALIRTGPHLLNGFLHCLLNSPLMIQQAIRAATGVAQKTVSLNSLRNFSIPLPPLSTQQAIVAEIEAEQALVAANRELITRFEKKIQTAIGRIWGEGGLVT